MALVLAGASSGADGAGPQVDEDAELLARMKVAEQTQRSIGSSMALAKQQQQQQQHAQQPITMQRAGGSHAHVQGSFQQNYNSGSGPVRALRGVNAPATCSNTNTNVNEQKQNSYQASFEERKAKMVERVHAQA